MPTEPYTPAELERRARYGAYVAARTEADRRGQPMPDDRTVSAALEAYRRAVLPDRDARIRVEAEAELRARNWRPAEEFLPAAAEAYERLDEKERARVRAEERARVAEQIAQAIEAGLDYGGPETADAARVAVSIARAHATPPTTEGTEAQ